MMHSESPVYIRYLEALSLRGVATRSLVEVERVLAVCRRCEHWTPNGCAEWIGVTPYACWPFAQLLADAARKCERW